MSPIPSLEVLLQAKAEFDSFHFKEERLYLLENWTGDLPEQNNDSEMECVFILNCEYCPSNEEELKHMHIQYDEKYWGSERFNQWLSKYNFHIEWENCCIVHVYVTK